MSGDKRLTITPSGIPADDKRQHFPMDPPARQAQTAVGNRRKSVAGALLALQAASKWRKSISSRGAPPSETSSLRGGKKGPKVYVENSYRTEPEKEDKLIVHHSRIERVVGNTLEEELGQFQYDAAEASKQSKSLANQIRERVKDLDIPRYKFVCNVFIAENREQGLSTVSRSLWNPATDTYISVNYANPSLHATAMVHGVYFD